MIQTFVSNKNLFVSRFKQLFAQIDDDESGYITMEEFLTHIENDAVQDFFATLDIDPSDALNLFKLISTESSTRGIDIEDFVVGCLRLKGAAKSCDMARLMCDNKLIVHEIGQLSTLIDMNFRKILGNNFVSAE